MRVTAKKPNRHDDESSTYTICVFDVDDEGSIHMLPLYYLLFFYGDIVA